MVTKLEVKDHPTGLAELESLKAIWQARRNEAAAKLAGLEAESGRRLLAGDVAVRQELAEARTDLLECEQVLLEVTRQQPLARALDNQQRAKGLRAEAEKLEAEAGRIEAEIEPHLAAIEAIEGCRFVPPPSPRFGWPPAKSLELKIRAGKLRDQAGDLEARAEEILGPREESKRKVVLAGWQV